MPDLAKPSAGSSITDPVFGSRLLRLTDTGAAGLPGAFPQYSKRQAWNVDESLLLLTSGDGTFALYDGSTYLTASPRFSALATYLAGQGRYNELY